MYRQRRRGFHFISDSACNRIAGAMSSAAISVPAIGNRAGCFAGTAADLPALALRAVDRLEKTLAAGDITRARREIRDQVATVTVEADEHEIRLYSEQGHIAAAMLRASGTHTSLYGSGGRIVDLFAAASQIAPCGNNCI
jgi:hypothetical protein